MRTTASFVALLLLTCFVNSAAAQGNSLLWKISGNGLLTPSYLYGTMHTKDARVFRLADSVLTAFESCEAFAMEVIIDDASKMNILQGLFMDTSYSLKNLLTTEQYDSADQYCRKNTGQSIKNYENLKPVYTAAILSQFVYNPSDSTGDDQQYFLDEYFQHLASGQQKKVHGLETIAEQLHVFDVLSYPHQAELLMQTVRRSNKEAKSYDQMVRYYLDNDLVKMMSFENDYSLPDSLYDGLITVRNHRMADRMDTMIKKRSTFVAVGAGHLGETEGLVNLLRDKGYTVLPVIPTYTNYLPNGWYRKISFKDHCKVDFPSVPLTSNEKISASPFMHYSAVGSTYATEKHDYDVYIGEGRQDSVLLHVLQHHYQMKVFLDKISPDALHDNKFELLLETTDGRNCTVQCFERNQQVYVLLYTYKRKVNKEFRTRFFSSFQLL
ncbi:MAG: TraB/GumN family protein [Chitinophagales bacterium]